MCSAEAAVEASKTKKATASDRTTLEEYFPEDAAAEGKLTELQSLLRERDRPPYFESRNGRAALEALQAEAGRLQLAAARLPLGDPGAHPKGTATPPTSRAATRQGVYTAQAQAQAQAQTQTQTQAAPATTPSAATVDSRADGRAGDAGAVAVQEAVHGELLSIPQSAAPSSGRVVSAERVRPQTEPPTLIRGATDSDLRASTQTAATVCGVTDEAYAATEKTAAAVTVVAMENAVAAAAQDVAVVAAVAAAPVPGGATDTESARPTADEAAGATEQPAYDGLTRNQPLPPICRPSSGPQLAAPGGVVSVVPEQVSAPRFQGGNSWWLSTSALR